MPIEMDDAECDGHAEGMLTARGGVGGRDQRGGWRRETMGPGLGRVPQADGRSG